MFHLKRKTKDERRKTKMSWLSFDPIKCLLYDIRPRCKPKKMTPKYRNFRLNFEISEISKEEGV